MYRVLVADDWPDSADALATVLRLAGYEVVTAYRGSEVESAARKLRPHVALLDLSMPEISGIDLARRLRAEYGDSIRLCALTGWGQSADRQRTAEAGFDGHLTKPVESDEIIRWIEALPGPRPPPPGAATG